MYTETELQTSQVFSSRRNKFNWKQQFSNISMFTIHTNPNTQNLNRKLDMQVSDISRGVEPHNRIRIVVPLGLGKVFTLPLSRLRLIGPGPVRVPIKRLLVDSTEPINLLASRGSLVECGSSHAAAAFAAPTCVSHIQTNDELDNPAKPSRPPAAGTSKVP